METGSDGKQPTNQWFDIDVNPERLLLCLCIRSV
jgi:hypothetical protein